LRLRNESACVLSISSVQITGQDSLAFAAAVPPLPITVAPQAEANFEVSFLPGRLGNHTARLLVHNDDPSRAILPITLFGEGDTTACNARIQVNALDLDFGAIALGDTAAFHFSIQNVGCDSLRIAAISTSVSAFSTGFEVRQLTLAPGASREATITFAPADTATYSGVLQIISNDPRNPTRIVPLNGRGKLPWTAVSRFVNFEQVCLGSEASAEFEICNISRRTLAAEVMLTSQPQFKTGTQSIVVPAGACRTIAVGFAPDVISIFRDTLTVTWQTPFRLPPLRIPLEGAGAAPQISALPVQVDFGSVILGTSSPPTFADIRNEGRCELIVNTIEIIGRDSTAFKLDNIVLPLAVPAGQFARLSVTYTPKDSSAHQAMLRITSSDPVNPVTVLPLRGAGRMLLAACINVLTDAVDFGRVRIKNQDSAWVYIQNCGNATLIVDQVKIDGRDYHFDRQSFRIAPQGVDSIKVYFAPGTVGRIDGKLLLHNNDPVNNMAVVDLTGSGLARAGAFVMAKPNPITPNGDGKNDVARITFYDFELFNPSVKLFDLRGIQVNTIFQQTAPGEIHWDGSDEHRQSVLPGVYLWVLEDGGKKIASGSITVIR
jgi:hypothetical protein